MKRLQAARVAYLAALAALVLLPFYWMFITAVRPREELAQSPASWLPTALSFRSFIDVWSAIPFATYLVNSLIVAAVTTVVSVAVSSAAAYSLVRYRPRGSGIIIAFVLFTVTIPGIVSLVPYYDLFTRIGALDTRWGLALSYTVWAIPFNVLLMRGYFENAYSIDVEEAALLDGCTALSVLWRMVLPLSRPGLVAAGTFTVLLSWNEFIWASVITSSDTTRTAPVGLQLFIGQYSDNQSLGLWMAGALLVTLPVVTGFLVVQRHLVTAYGGVNK